MDNLEQRLLSQQLRKPPEALRERVLSGAASSRSEWKRFLYTLEGCAATLLVVSLWCFWYEAGSESLRLDCRTIPPDVYRFQVEAQLKSQADGDPVAYEYALAKLMDAYTAPYVVRPDS